MRGVMKCRHYAAACLLILFYKLSGQRYIAHMKVVGISHNKRLISHKSLDLQQGMSCPLHLGLTAEEDICLGRCYLCKLSGIPFPHEHFLKLALPVEVIVQSFLAAGSKYKNLFYS